jgi:hypothetical protein
MSHGYHEGPEDALLFDGCDECDARAADPIDALLRLDPERFETLWQRMRATEYGDAAVPDRLRKANLRYRSTNEAKVGKHLYYVSLLLQRFPESLLAREHNPRR